MWKEVQTSKARIENVSTVTPSVTLNQLNTRLKKQPAGMKANF